MTFSNVIYLVYIKISFVVFGLGGIRIVFARFARSPQITMKCVYFVPGAILIYLYRLTHTFICECIVVYAYVGRIEREKFPSLFSTPRRATPN